MLESLGLGHWDMTLIFERIDKECEPGFMPHMTCETNVSRKSFCVRIDIEAIFGCSLRSILETLLHEFLHVVEADTRSVLGLAEQVCSNDAYSAIHFAIMNASEHNVASMMRMLRSLGVDVVQRVVDGYSFTETSGDKSVS